MSEIVVKQKIDRPPVAVAKIMFDPGNDTKWIDGAKKVEAFDGDATAIGMRVKRHGAFWGRDFAWVTETTAHEPDAKFAFKYVEGPMTGEVTYSIAPDGTGSTVTIHHTGATLAMPGAEAFVKRTLQSDLGRLKKLVERQPK
ncbi:MAG TPA: SRPBCC family protein [Rhizomicrobium sp.]